MAIVNEHKDHAMLRTVIVTIGGLILSALLAAAATSFMLSHTQFGRLMTGNSSGMTDPWQVFSSGSKVLFFYVSLPTVVLVAVFVGLLAKEFPLGAAAVAVLPISVLASGLVLRGAWISLVLIFCALLLALFSQRLARRVIAGATKPSPSQV
jgi:hypothetical protein